MPWPITGKTVYEMRGPLGVQPGEVWRERSTGRRFTVERVSQERGDCAYAIGVEVFTADGDSITATHRVDALTEACDLLFAAVRDGDEIPKRFYCRGRSRGLDEVAMLQWVCPMLTADEAAACSKAGEGREIAIEPLRALVLATVPRLGFVRRDPKPDDPHRCRTGFICTDCGEGAFQTRAEYDAHGCVLPCSSKSPKWCDDCGKWWDRCEVGEACPRCTGESKVRGARGELRGWTTTRRDAAKLAGTHPRDRYVARHAIQRGQMVTTADVEPIDPDARREAEEDRREAERLDALARSRVGALWQDWSTGGFKRDVCRFFRLPASSAEDGGIDVRTNEPGAVVVTGRAMTEARAVRLDEELRGRGPEWLCVRCEPWDQRAANIEAVSALLADPPRHLLEMGWRRGAEYDVWRAKVLAVLERHNMAGVDIRDARWLFAR